MTAFAIGSLSVIGLPVTGDGFKVVFSYGHGGQSSCSIVIFLLALF